MGAPLANLAPMDDAPRAQTRLAGPALFAASAVACILFCADLIGRPVDDLVGYVSDDAFYYLQIARRLVDTHVTSFDGQHPTNGYHPAWLAITTVLAKVFPDRETLLRAALWASFALHLGASLLLVRLCRRFVPALWAWVLGAVWTINPLPITLAMQGVEAPLVLLAWMVVADVFAGRIAPRLGRSAPLPSPGTEASIPRRDLVLLGAALGALFWARTDGIVVAAATFAFLACSVPLRDAGRVVGVASATFAASIVPWFAWSYWMTSAFVQDSGAVKMIWASAARAADPSSSAVTDGLRFVAGRWFGLPASLVIATPRAVGAALAAAILVVVAAGFVSSRRRSDDGALRRTTAWLAATALTLGFVSGAALTDQMVWYFGPPGLALFLVVALFTARLLGRVAALGRPALHAAGGAALVVGAIFLFSRYRERMPFEYPWQRDVLASHREFEKLVPKGEHIGCFNAGIPGYFGERRVVNLDGLVNHELVAVYRRRELMYWISAEDLRWIADEPLALGRAQKLTQLPIRLTEVSSAPLRGWMSPRRYLWKVEPR